MNWEEFLSRLSPESRDQLRTVPVDVKTPGEMFHVVLNPLHELPELKSFTTVSAMRAYLKQLYESGESAQCYMFFGVQLRMTKPPFPYLILPGGQAFPLFDTEPQLEFNESGWVGDTEEFEIEQGDEDADDIDVPVGDTEFDGEEDDDEAATDEEEEEAIGLTDEDIDEEEEHDAY